MLVPAQRILIGVIICLGPLLIYCLLLMAINGRRRASIIPGTWDFAGVLLATAGFVLGGGPLILAGFNAGWRRYLLHGKNVTDWRMLTGEGDVRAVALWVLFFVIIISCAAILIFARRNVTVLYNVDTAHIWNALEWIFGRVGIVWKRHDNAYELRRVRQDLRTPWVNELRPMDRFDKNIVAQTTDQPVEVRAEAAQLKVHVLPTNCNVTLVWDQFEPGIRAQVEAELSSLLTNIRAEHNPVVGWLATAATVILASMLGAMVWVIVLLIQNRTAL